MDAGWRIELLGELSATRGEHRVTRFRSQKTAALLAYLAYYRQRAHPRQVLIDLLWPDHDVELARHNLSVALSSLREQLETSGGILVTDRFSVGLNPCAVTTDVAEFESALQTAAEARSVAEQAQRLSAAAELYRGPLLPGYYESWVLPEQQRLDELFFRALRQLIAHLERTGQFEPAIEYARRAVGADPLREEAHRELIRLYAAAAQPGAALRQYRELERILKQELNATPGAATRALLASLTDERPAAKQHAVPVTPSPPLPFTPSVLLEPVGGAVPLDSPFYVVRPTDERFAAAIARQDSIVLVKGPRQVGKTSLLARGLQQARQAGARVVLTDFETFNAAHLESAETLLFALAQSLADQLDVEVAPAGVWDPRRGPNPNFRRYLHREVLGRISGPMVWGLDEVDRLFGCDYGTEIFGLFRSWHNERALDPSGPWSRLTLAMAYATEAHLFITDLNKSPFNVGTRLSLDDFTREQVADLNRRYGSPLTDETELTRFYDLVSGHPYLVGAGLHEMATQGSRIGDFEARAASDGGIFGDHLQRLLVPLDRDPELRDVMQGVLAGRPCPTPRSFYRLRSAGLLAGDSEDDARPRCRLYATYLARHLS
jgi:DNA-binding SARP family transcriptional activator